MSKTQFNFNWIMKIVLLLITISCANPLDSRFNTFNLVEYENEGRRINNKIKLKKQDTLDLEFYVSNFDLPSELNLDLFSQKYKNECVVIENDKNDSLSATQIWFNYDDKSRLTEYTYGGCLTCGMQAYTIKIIYTDNLAILYKGKPFEQDVDLAKCSRYKIYFDNRQNITRLEKINLDRLIKKIELVKKQLNYRG